MHRCPLPASQRCPNISDRHITPPSCEACDVCLNELEGLADATVTAQKILSCVARAGERFGAEHIVDVLLGADTNACARWGTTVSSAPMAFEGTRRKAARDHMLYQLLDHGLLERTADERPVLRLNAASGRSCAVNAAYGCCSLKWRSATARFAPIPGQASTAACSRVCVRCGAMSLVNAACRLTSSSAMLPCGTWRACGRDLPRRC